ncbi:unnamed protein product [Onchocerca flexuosa]|uniref:Ragulator complex protein LAMTOR1 n=1 Tax=Onchocerca flexuosa TaxID=387005 RepID=A0A183I071_9BILA|nr:unnamed protein product [Onchocerca flexuosa]
MGCRFSRTNDADLEIDSDSTNVTAETANQSLIETTEYLVNSQSVLTSNIPEALNPTIVSDEGSVKETTASTDYMKNTCSSVHWNTPIRDRIKLRPKQVESASQADFFRMLDEKIAQVKDQGSCIEDHPLQVEDRTS